MVASMAGSIGASVASTPAQITFLRPSPPLVPPAARPLRPTRPHRAHRTAASRTADVFESLTLLRFPDDTDQDAVSAVVDKVWSLQYLAGGPIVGCAGPLVPLPGAAGAALAPPFTHAVLFRYGQDSIMRAFLGNERIQEMLERGAASAAADVSTLCFTSAVPNELEAIFRRGSEWDEGVEAVIALKLQPGCPAEDAAEFLSLTQQLAGSSAFGAVQAVSGRASDLLQHLKSEENEKNSAAAACPDFVLLVRFEGKQQLESFVECPPVAAMLEGDERSPLAATWAAAIEIAPAANSNSSPQRGAPRMP